MFLNCFIPFVANLATIVSCVIAFVTMIYTILLYRKAKLIQETVDIEMVNRFLKSLNKLDDYLYELNFHSCDGLNEKNLHKLESLSKEIIGQINGFKLSFSYEAFKAQKDLKGKLRDCVERCKLWTDIITENPDAKIDEYLQEILEKIAHDTHNLIECVIKEIRHSTVK